MRTTIRNLKIEDIPICASIAISSSLQSVYGFTENGWKEKLEKAYLDDENLLFVVEYEKTIAGFAWAHPRGAFLCAPYLRFISVRFDMQGKGIGKLLLEEYENRTRHIQKDFFLLVSDFNAGAIQFYTKHGYERVGILPDFSVIGVNEILMIKKNPKICK